MQRLFSPQALGCNPQQTVRPQGSLWRLAHATKCHRPACVASSAVDNREPEATAGGSAPSATTTPSSRLNANNGPDYSSATRAAAGTNNPDANNPDTDSGTGASSPGAAEFLFSPAFLRRLAAATSPLDLAEALADESPPGYLPREEDARAVMGFCLQRGRVQLALGVYREMCAARRGGGNRGSSGGGGGNGAGGGVGAGGFTQASRSLDVAFAWPAATLATTTELVMGLCQQLCIVEALQVLADIKVQGLPRGSEEVGFGKVITSPLAPDRPLTVVQPQEGAKVVADGYSRYEYELFSGTVLSCSSTALVPPGNMLLRGLGRRLGLIRKPPVAAVHEFVLQAPDSTSRTFRVGTETTAVPAQVGERVTVVSAPTRNVRKGGLFNASPPGAKPGEALTATNHKTGVVLPLLKPPVSAEQANSLPSWVLPLVVLLAGGDAASSLLDPALPLLLAASAVSLAGGSMVGSQVLVPKLKQLPDTKVRVEYVRQQLLGQYNALASKAATVLTESSEDIRVLARLWQLQNKMEAVSASSSSPSTLLAQLPPSLAGAGSGSAAAAYEARIGRVSRARANIEERLARRIELLEGYGRVMSMIEIEVEMDIEVPAAEVAGIQEQLARLVELEAVQEDWRAQAEARDEVERLLRAA
ncbi:hypothetical protein Agub_g3629 [Astrephomene gubernaculifera]|uniref:Uncharacterized protein n=1 Tax=Astrephomene gubernaculifera TaxID=47775 RepID=A0AAD3DMT6_9CHLO|nr:hypothetical protein Agub_g3629 [Astrephomene gubernaculifera]